MMTKPLKKAPKPMIGMFVAIAVMFVVLSSGSVLYAQQPSFNMAEGLMSAWQMKEARQAIEALKKEQPGSAEVLTYADLWAYTSMEAVVRTLYTPWMNWNQAWNDWFWGPLRGVNGTTKNTQTLSMCNAAKNSGIIVFTIGFEAPTSGNTILQQCASSVSHFFDVQGLEISDAFDAIASSIRQLRLTQ
jgi:hypothetical protein